MQAKLIALESKMRTLFRHEKETSLLKGIRRSCNQEPTLDKALLQLSKDEFGETKFYQHILSSLA